MADRNELVLVNWFDEDLTAAVTSAAPDGTAATATLTLYTKQNPSAPLRASAALAMAAAVFVPVAPFPESVSLDKFEPRVSQPVMPRRLGAREGWTVIDGKQLTLGESSQPDKWGYPVSQPYPFRPLKAREGYFAIDTTVLTQPEVVHAQWSPLLPDIQFRRQVLTRDTNGTFVAVVTATEVVTVDKWAINTEQPLSPRPRQVREGLTVLGDLPRAESASVDRFGYPVSQPYPFRRLPAREGLSVRGDVPRTEAVSVDRFGYPIVQPYPLRQLPTRTGLSILGDIPRAESVSIDRWHRATEQPYPLRRLPTRTGLSVLGDVPRVETVSFDRWAFRQSEPRFDVKRQQYLYPPVTSDSQMFLVPGVEIINVDKWKGQAPDFIYRLRRLSDYGLTITSMTGLLQPEQVSIDRWHPSIERPYPARTKPAREGWITTDPSQITATIVSVDQFHPAIERPYPSRRVAAREGLAILGDIPRLETVQLDKFEPHVSQPYPFRATTRVRLEHFSVDLTQPAVVVDDVRIHAVITAYAPTLNFNAHIPTMVMNGSVSTTNLTGTGPGAKTAGSGPTVITIKRT